MYNRSTPPRPACANSSSSNSNPSASIGGSSKRIKASRIFSKPFANPGEAPQNKKGDPRPPFSTNPASTRKPRSSTKKPLQGAFKSATTRRLESRAVRSWTQAQALRPPAEGRDYRQLEPERKPLIARDRPQKRLGPHRCGPSC